MSEKITPIMAVMPVSEQIAHIAQEIGMPQAQVRKVFDAQRDLIRSHMHPDGSGEISLFGMLKVKRAVKPATPEKTGKNPLTGKEITIAAKPERNVPKITATKALKDSVL